MAGSVVFGTHWSMMDISLVSQFCQATWSEVPKVGMVEQLHILDWQEMKARWISELAPLGLKWVLLGTTWVSEKLLTMLVHKLACRQRVQWIVVIYIVILPRMLCYSWLLHPPPFAGVPVFLQSCLQSPFGLPDVDPAGDMTYHIDWFTKR